MTATPSFEDELVARLLALHDLSTSAPRKYDELETWLAAQFMVDTERVTTVYLSDLSKQFTARVGASLVSEPLVLIVLGTGDFDRPNDQNISQVDRLARICAYVGRIQLVIVAEGEESHYWNVRCVLGPHTSDLFDAAQELLPDAEAVGVIVPPL